MGGGSGRSDYVLQWLGGPTPGPTENDENPAIGQEEQGFAGRLYQICFRALQSFHRKERDQRSSSLRTTVLREYLGKFYLWGEPFGIGELEKALEQSDELRETVLDRLCHIGKLLLRGKLFKLSKGPFITSLTKNSFVKVFLAVNEWAIEADQRT